MTRHIKLPPFVRAGVGVGKAWTGSGLLKTCVSILYILIIAAMAAATFIEKWHGTGFARAAVYSAWWFTALWALLAAAGVAYIIKRRVRRPSVVALHLALVLILAGALATHVSGRRGTVHLRSGVPVSKWTVDGGERGGEERELPFTMTMKKCEVVYHEGTEAEADYVTVFTVADGGGETVGRVSMNNIYRRGGMRFYQASFDRDMLGSTLAVNCDPAGIPLTYAGYLLLFVSLLWALADPRGAYRRLLRSPLLKRGALVLACAACFAQNAGAAGVLPEETAEKFGRLYILYNNRVCPLQTFAVDFTKKLCGSAEYKGYTAEQVLTGFIFYGDEWCAEPVIRLKAGPLRETLQLPRMCSVNTFFNSVMGGYILGPYVREYYQGQDDKFHKQVADVDDRLMMIMSLRRGTPLKVFPVTAGGKTTWHSPTDDLTGAPLDSLHRKYVQNVFSLIYQEVLAGRTANVDAILDKMLKYQRANGGASLPADVQVKAERVLNAVPFATVLFMVNLSAGLLLVVLAVYFIVKEDWNNGRTGSNERTARVANAAGPTLLALSFTALTACLALRWTASGRVPMANGYETMLVLAWAVMLAALAACRRFRIIAPFGLLASGFFLLVSHISAMDPQITHVMPVLQSPLLSVHVSVIMMSFALLSLTFVCGVTALVLSAVKGKGSVSATAETEQLALLSRLMLHPAVALLAVGVFVGAVWANVSWGSYWSWDAKETWGLITLLVYAVAVHDASLPFLRRARGYHLYMVCAFLTIIMTYFGVNYFLGGIHSYA